jgi:hypothetical protein
MPLSAHTAHSELLYLARWVSCNSATAVSTAACASSFVGAISIHFLRASMARHVFATGKSNPSTSVKGVACKAMKFRYSRVGVCVCVCVCVCAGTYVCVCACCVHLHPHAQLRIFVHVVPSYFLHQGVHPGDHGAFDCRQKLRDDGLEEGNPGVETVEWCNRKGTPDGCSPRGREGNSHRENSLWK